MRVLLVAGIYDLNQMKSGKPIWRVPNWKSSYLGLRTSFTIWKHVPGFLLDLENIVEAEELSRPGRKSPTEGIKKGESELGVWPLTR